MNRRILLAAAGAVLFYALDSLHVSVGIWSAAAAHGVPWWYGLVYFAGILLAAQLLAAIDRRTRPRDRGGLAVDGGAFAFLLVAPLLLFRQEAVLAGIALAVLAARLTFFRRPGDVWVAAAIAGIDALVEWSMASASLFSYAH